MLIFSEHLFFSIAIAVIGLIAFIAIQGVIIDYDKHKIKPYVDLILFKAGLWKDLNQYNQIILKFLNESQTINVSTVRRIFTTKTFDIYLQNEKGKKIILKEFMFYENAKNFLEKYAEKLDKEKLNTYEIEKQKY